MTMSEIRSARGHAHCTLFFFFSPSHLLSHTQRVYMHDARDSERAKPGRFFEAPIVRRRRSGGKNYVSWKTDEGSGVARNTFAGRKWLFPSTFPTTASPNRYIDVTGFSARARYCARFVSTLWLQSFRREGIIVSRFLAKLPTILCKCT